MDNIPSDLLGQPRPSVFLVGLPNEHDKIKERFQQTTDARVRNFVIKSITQDDFLPQRRTPLDRSDNGPPNPPEGILRYSWVKKHTLDIPACIVAFFDAAESIAEADAKLGKDIERIKALRNGQLARIILVFLNTGATPDISAELMERKIDAIRKMVDPLTTVTSALDAAGMQRLIRFIGDTVSSACKDKSARLKKRASQRLHAALLARVNFKIAFFAEMRGDLPGAVKYYMTAYSNLRNTLPALSVSEVKKMSEIVQYKVVFGLLIQNKVQDAVDQHMRHIQAWRSVSTSMDQPFAHYAWLSRQYEIFGDTLKSTTEKNVAANEDYSQPGYHYRCAADYARKRALAAQPVVDKYLEMAIKMETTSDLKFSDPEYIGQPKQLLPHPLAPSGAVDDAEGELASFLTESRVNHREEIVRLLWRAFNEYRKRSSGITLHLAYELGLENMAMSEYQQALTSFSRLAPNFRAKKWWALMTATTRECVACAEELGNADTYFENAVILLGKDACIEDEDQAVMQKELESFAYGRGGLTTKFPSAVFPLTYEMDADHTFLQCRGVFDKASAVCGTNVTLTLSVIVDAPLPILLSKISVLFTDSQFNLEVNDQTSLLIPPNLARDIQFTMTSKTETVIEIASIVCEYGPNVVYRKSFAPKPIEPPSDDYALPAAPAVVVTAPRVKFMQPPPQLTVTFAHAAPALVGSSFPVTVSLNANGDEIESGEVILECLSVEGPAPTLTDLEGQPLTSVTLPHCGVSSVHPISVLIHAKDVAKCTLRAQCRYRTNGRDAVAEAGMAFACVLPFHIAYTLYDQQRRPVSNGRVAAERPFIVSCAVSTASPHSVYLDSVSCVSDKTVFVSSSSDVKGRLMKKDEVHTVILQQQCHAPAASVELGELQLLWRRTADDTQQCKQCVAIPAVTVVAPDFDISVGVPQTARVAQPLNISISVVNLSKQTHILTASVAESETFLLAGARLTQFDVAPGGTHVLKFVLVPIHTGLLLLPEVKFRSKRLQDALVGGGRDYTTVLVLPSPSMEQPQTAQAS